MEKESIQTVLSYEHQREIGKSGFRKGHGSRASRKVISMRNNPKVQCWEKSKQILWGQQGRSAEVSCVRRLCRSSQPLVGGQVAASGTRSLPVLTSAPVPCPLLCIPPPLDTPAAARPQTGLLRSAGGRGNTAGLAEKVSVCWVSNGVLPNCPACLDLGWLPPSWLPCPSTQLPSISWDYSEMGEDLYGRH